MYVHIHINIYMYIAFFFNFYWSITDLQCFVSLCCTTKWFSYTYTYIHSGEGNVQTHSNIFTWRIPRTEEPGQLQSMGSQRDRHIEWLTHTHTVSLSLFLRYYSHIGHYKILKIVPCAINRFLLVVLLVGSY